MPCMPFILTSALSFLVFALSVHCAVIRRTVVAPSSS
jgi:hypothetical protein